jgi:hypothetical protein
MKPSRSWLHGRSLGRPISIIFAQLTIHQGHQAPRDVSSWRGALRSYYRHSCDGCTVARISRAHPEPMSSAPGLTAKGKRIPPSTPDPESHQIYDKTKTNPRRQSEKTCNRIVADVHTIRTPAKTCVFDRYVRRNVQRVSECTVAAVFVTV